MIRIDHILFEFAAPGEDFAHSLYADWDGFCHTCFEDIVEECFSEYDRDKVLHEIETINLDLGSIPEEDFYREFPLRLREQLLKIQPSLNIPEEGQEERTRTSRIGNLLFYLEHGYWQTEWADSDFGLSEELDWAVLQQARYADEIVKFCLGKEYALRRLLWQTDDDKALVRLYSAALSTASFGVNEKRRFLKILLEMKPGIPVRFIHETTDNAELRDMAELLDTLSVRRIMETETEEHAEVDLPPYWHYLYEWLVRYYPFNGLAIFGGKGDFIRHLHHRLLTFIHKRNYSFYLSRTELTAAFLLEVFGPAYYIEVLNAIYNLQPHHADGSPVYDGYLNKELYRIFLQLSLLRRPVTEEELKEEPASGKDKATCPTSVEELAARLKDTQTSEAEKRMLLGLLAKEKPEILTEWLQAETDKGNIAVSAWVSAVAELANDIIINRLLASISFRTMEVALQVKDYLRHHAPEIGWLKGIAESRLDFALRKAILLWIGNRHTAGAESESIRQLLRQVYREITGSDREESMLEDLSIKLDMQGSGVYLTDATALTTFLKDTRRTAADKRMLLGTWIKERPIVIVNWLQTEAVKDNTLIIVAAELVDDAMINRLLASVSLKAMEVALQVSNFLSNYQQNHTLGISWLNGIAEARLGFILRKAILLWIGNGHTAGSESESIRQLLRPVCREITGSDKEEDIEKLSIELSLPEKNREELAEKKETYLSDAYIRKLKTILVDKSVPELIKRRMLTLLLEQSEDGYADTVLLLHEQGLLEDALGLMNQPVLEEIIRQSVLRISGADRVMELLPLLYWLVIHEPDIFTYLRNTASGLKMQLLVWLARTTRSQINTKRTATELLSSLLDALFIGENIPSVISRMSRRPVEVIKTGDAEYDDAECNDIETALSFLLDAGQSQSGGKGHSPKRDFEKWWHQLEDILEMIQTLLESRWSTDEDFTDWLEDAAASADNKQELLQKLVVEKPQEWIRLLRKLPEESKAVTLVATHLSAFQLLQGMARADFYQASVLSRTVEWLQRSADRHVFLTGSGIPLSTALSKALLFYMQDKDTLGGRTLTESEMIYKFLSYLHLTYTGKTDYRDDAQWAVLSGKMAADLGADDWQEMQKREIAEVLLHQDTSDAVFSRNIISLMERQPEQLLAWLEKDAGSSLIKRIVATSDRMMPGQWTAFLGTASGLEHPDAFRRLMEWIHRIADVRVSDTASVLLSWLKETDWRKQTPEQMEAYFISRLFGTNALRLTIERITDTALPENIRRRLLHNYIRFQPHGLSDYIRQSVKRNVQPLKVWLEWLDIGDWIRLATNLSLSRAELLQQIVDYLSKSGQAKEADLRTALATCHLNNCAEEWIYNSREETVRSFVQSLPSLQEKTEAEKENTVKLIKEALNITEAEDYPVEEQTESPDILLIGNAGLCLLAAWFPRLLELLGYLNEDKKDFKDTAFKVRAVFLLQYLTCSEEKEYRETELAFNRLLVSLPMHIPLPDSLELTDKEKQTAESMLAGVKANWQAMSGTSVKGFQESFILRTGRLEQQEEKWLLTVDNKTIDILLDTVRWGFRQIRFPWLKKHVQVVWHEKQEF